jgi:hypothetical protein
MTLASLGPQLAIGNWRFAAAENLVLAVSR